MTRVLLLEDDDVVRAEFAAVVAAAGHDVVAVGDAAAALAAVGDVDVAFVDLDLDGRAAFDVVKDLKALAPAVAVVALTGHADDAWLLPALAAGCCGYLLKAEASSRLPAVVDEAAAGGVPLSPVIARRVLARAASLSSASPSLPSSSSSSSLSRPALSMRERESVALLAEGLSYEEIAQRLDVSLSTVRTYLQRAYAKLGVETKSAATAEAFRRGLVQ